MPIDLDILRACLAHTILVPRRTHMGIWVREFAYLFNSEKESSRSFANKIQHIQLIFSYLFHFSSIQLIFAYRRRQKLFCKPFDLFHLTTVAECIVIYNQPSQADT
jgi:hypothetical protein